MNNIVTIDGPASSGKTSVGVRLANKLGFQFIDSGSIYRAGCHYLLQQGLPTHDDKYASEIFKSLDLSFSARDNQYTVHLFGEDVTQSLDSSQVTELVPIVGGRKFVREIVKQKQQELAFGRDTVITGRDIGSEIFPHAPVKFYIFADPEIRALRRFRQLQETGIDADYDVILEKINYRDKLDSTREVSPFRVPENALHLDTSRLNIEEVVQHMHTSTLRLLEEKRGVEGNYFRPKEML